MEIKKVAAKVGNNSATKTQAKVSNDNKAASNNSAKNIEKSIHEAVKKEEPARKLMKPDSGFTRKYDGKDYDPGLRINLPDGKDYDPGIHYRPDPIYIEPNDPSSIFPQKPNDETMPNIKPFDFDELPQEEPVDEPTIKGTRTTTTTDEDGKTTTTTQDVDVSVEEYLDAAKAALNEEEADPNVKTEYDQDSIKDALWKTGDADGDGYINEDEYKTMIQDLLDIKDVSDLDELMKNSDLAKSLMEKDGSIDANGDGKLTRDEFNNSILNYILTEPDKLKTEANEEAEANEEVAANEAEAPAEVPDGTEVNDENEEVTDENTEEGANEETETTEENPLQPLLDFLKKLFEGADDIKLPF